MEFGQRDKEGCQGLFEGGVQIGVGFLFDSVGSVYRIDEGKEIETDLCKSFDFLPERRHFDEFFGSRTRKIEIND